MDVGANGDGVEALRLRVAGAVRSLIGGSDDGIRFDMSSFDSPAGDPGLLGPDSVAWRVGSDAAMLIGGVRALLMQTVHPLAMAGVADHSTYRTDPWGRLQRTAMYVSTTTFGSTAAAHKMIEQVTKVHRSVNGVAPDGRAYSALDPDLLCWVHVTEVESFATSVAAYGNCELSGHEIDKYYAEMATIGSLMGATGIPTTRAETTEYYERLAPELAGSKQAREAARFLFWPPVPTRLRPAYLAIVAAAVATLPEAVKQHLWLPNAAMAERILIEPSGRFLAEALRWALGESPIVAASHARAAAPKA